ncbi:MAG: carboxylate-amine ligase [Paracoccus sp. (in: a-proteobacteria)]|uniref:carboxylate-amine ligase n=1 Tax=Paracoccus sp. TaxID=267 RepID=UPI0026E0BB81|nr:carboxylate-amine ligase [Paracoccus sp. (in: a-proteobacteria)]MDO5613561.1 carboxylate-amine ligase [Paracoccus sp. (in: a-proteobacteria)]
MPDSPDFTLGIEEEYLLVDQQTGDLSPMPESLLEECRADLGDRVSPEYLRCQIEVGTGVCRDIAQARAELCELRETVAHHAGRHGLAPISASCHPYADWRDQHHTDKDRYNALRQDLAGVARRMLISGMHVHIGLPDRDRRIDLMNQFVYFLPHLLALSASSPFWQGEDTGLASYRLTVFGNLPRTGLPPRLDSWGDYERSVQALTDIGVIEDGSKLWWDLRPSARFPTLETRICDACPRLEDTLTLAALIQSTTRMLWRLSQRNQRWRIYDNFLLNENRWRALRYGGTEGLIDFGRRRVVPFADLVDEWIDLIAPDAEALNCAPEVARARDMVQRGTSAARQRAVLASAMAAGAPRDQALRAVVMELIGEYRAA